MVCRSFFALLISRCICYELHLFIVFFISSTIIMRKVSITVLTIQHLIGVQQVYPFVSLPTLPFLSAALIFFSSHNLRITYMCTWSAQKQQVPANQRQCLVTSRTHQESCANNDGRKIQGHQTLWRVILQKVKLYHTLVRVCCYGVCDVCYGEWICAQMGLFVHVRVWKAERLYIKSPLKRGYSGETFCFFLVR